MTAKAWASVSAEPISKDAIRAFHTPNGHFRFSPGTYQPGTAFPVLARASTFYVLSGSCSIRIKASGEDIELRAGEFAELPDGEYHFAVTSDQPIKKVQVFLLPEGFRKP